MKLVCSIHAHLCRESIRPNIWRSCVLYTILLLLYFESLFALTRSICGFCKGSEWLYSRNPMSHRWLSMTIARKRNKYAGDQVCLNISAEDVIMQIDFLIKRLHGDFLIKRLHGFLHFSEAIIEDLYEVCGRGRSHGSCQIASWIHIVFHSWRLCLSPSKAITRFVLLVVKLLCFCFLFRINGVIIKKLNYFSWQYNENQFI